MTAFNKLKLKNILNKRDMISFVQYERAYIKLRKEDTFQTVYIHPLTLGVIARTNLHTFQRIMKHKRFNIIDLEGRYFQNKNLFDKILQCDIFEIKEIENIVNFIFFNENEVAERELNIIKKIQKMNFILEERTNV